MSLGPRDQKVSSIHLFREWRPPHPLSQVHWEQKACLLGLQPTLRRGHMCSLPASGIVEKEQQDDFLGFCPLTRELDATLPWRPTPHLVARG
jgi:hypothetical protein